MSSFVTVIGTVFVDCKGFARNEYIPNGRNLGSIQFVHGGVGRNVAENLANLELATSFISTVENSGLGEEIMQRLSQNNIHTDYMGKVSQGMGMWLAILDEKGDLAGSISQMPDLAQFETIIDASGKDIIQSSSHIVLELDLNEKISKSVLATAAEQGKPVFGIPGNLDVILRNKSMLQQLECFICNDIEAGRLFEKETKGWGHENWIEELILYVNACGIRSMVVTLGERGSVYYDARTRQSGYQPVFPVQLVDSSGAGDAFFSGTVMGLVRGLPLSKAVICGTKVAAWTIESKENNCADLKQKIHKDEYFQAVLVK